MAENIETVSSFLFTNELGESIQFIIRPSKTRAHFKPFIEKGGGCVSSRHDPAMKDFIKILPEEDECTSDDYFSPKFIEDCVIANTLLDRSNYRVTPSNQVKGGGSSVVSVDKPVKGRSHYSQDEDHAILSYIARHPHGYGGNKVWKRMELLKITCHPWQSMRDHFKKKLEHKLSGYIKERQNRIRIQLQKSDGAARESSNIGDDGSSDEEEESVYIRRTTDEDLEIDKEEEEAEESEMEKQDDGNADVALVSTSPASSTSSLDIFLLSAADVNEQTETKSDTRPTCSAANHTAVHTENGSSDVVQPTPRRRPIDQQQNGDKKDGGVVRNLRSRASNKSSNNSNTTDVATTKSNKRGRTVTISSKNKTLAKNTKSSEKVFRSPTRDKNSSNAVASDSSPRNTNMNLRSGKKKGTNRNESNTQTTATVSDDSRTNRRHMTRSATATRSGATLQSRTEAKSSDPDTDIDHWHPTDLGSWNKDNDDDDDDDERMEIEEEGEEACQVGDGEDLDQQGEEWELIGEQNTEHGGLDDDDDDDTQIEELNEREDGMDYPASKKPGRTNSRGFPDPSDPILVRLTPRRKRNAARRTPNKSPRRTPNKSPRRTPTKSPRRTPTKSPRRTPTKSPTSKTGSSEKAALPSTSPSMARSRATRASKQLNLNGMRSRTEEKERVVEGEQQGCSTGEDADTEASPAKRKNRKRRALSIPESETESTSSDALPKSRMRQKESTDDVIEITPGECMQDNDLKRQIAECNKHVEKLMSKFTLPPHLVYAALYMNNGSMAKTEAFLNLKGHLWTVSDDKMVQSSRSNHIQCMRNKHGEAEASERLRWLQN